MLVLPVLFRDACIDEQDVDAAMLFFTSATSDFTAVGHQASEEITSMPGTY